MGDAAVRGGCGEAAEEVKFLILLLCGVPLHAQSLRDFDYARPLGGERQLRAVIQFAAGQLTVGAAASDRLYQLSLRYDSERFEPVGSFDAGAGVVALGVESRGRGGIRVDRRSALPQTAIIEFSRAVALALEVSLGAAEAELELGGLKVAELTLKSGASRTTVGFATPNPGTCRSASIASGAGEVTVTRAGNSGCPFWSFDGGVGSVTIDLDGAWRADGRIKLNMALGGVKLIAPKGLGLRVSLNGFLAGFDGSGFSKSGKTYTSAGYAAAARKVDVDVSSALGGVSVVWRDY